MGNREGGREEGMGAGKEVGMVVVGSKVREQGMGGIQGMVRELGTVGKAGRVGKGGIFLAQGKLREEGRALELGRLGEVEVDKGVGKGVDKEGDSKRPLEYQLYLSF